jgi:hypothetical protein
MTRQRQITSFTMAVAVALAGAALDHSPTFAAIIGDALTIIATNPAGDVATFQIPVPVGATSFAWSSHEMVEMRSETTGDLIAILNPEGRPSAVEYIDDPSVGMAISVQAGPTPTTFMVASALLTFPPLTAEGRATTGFTVTDFDGDGVTLTGIGDPAGAMGAYLAQYNGFAGSLSGTTFAEVIPGVTAGEFASNTESADVPLVGFTPIAVPVLDMSVLLSFDLTANDQASVTSVFVTRQQSTATESTSWGRIKLLF